jgi:hypothetical protein
MIQQARLFCSSKEELFMDGSQTFHDDLHAFFWPIILTFSLPALHSEFTVTSGNSRAMFAR